jgi:hypothetical protein
MKIAKISIGDNTRGYSTAVVEIGRSLVIRQTAGDVHEIRSVIRQLRDLAKTIPYHASATNIGRYGFRVTATSLCGDSYPATVHIWRFGRDVSSERVAALVSYLNDRPRKEKGTTCN